jgi:TolA-binding protein
MELQDAPETYLFKLWPWIEANKVRLACGGGVLIIAAGAIWFYSAQKAQKEIDAGMALSKMAVADTRNITAAQQADSLLKLAGEYQNTAAGQRALLQSAAMLFEAGKYPDAQTRFQDFLNQYPGSFFAGQAALGVASCLDAQGKPDAAAAYQRIINTYSDTMVVNLAKFSLAQIDEHQNKPTEAFNLYQEIVRTLPNSPLASEATMHAMELKTKQPAAPAATNQATPFKLTP